MTNVTFDEGEDFTTHRRPDNSLEKTAPIADFFIRHSFGIIRTRAASNAFLLLVIAICAIAVYTLHKESTTYEAPTPLTPLVNTNI
jgi:3-phosphoglycerate kinase